VAYLNIRLLSSFQVEEREMNGLFRDLSLIHARDSGRIRLGVFYFEKEGMRR
jgi:hypothetical protein